MSTLPLIHPAALVRARIQLWWFRLHMPHWFALIGSILIGGVIGIGLAVLGRLDVIDGDAALSLLPLVWLFYMLFIFTRISAADDDPHGRPASSAFIVAAFARMPADLRGHLHAELERRGKRACRALDRSEVVEAMELVERRFGIKAVAKEAARKAALAEQRRMLAACDARPRLRCDVD